MSKLQKCCVWNCNINSINNPNVLFFNLPKNEERYKYSIDFCCRDDLMLEAYCNEVTGFNNLVGKICELHFIKTMNKADLKKKILKNALPTLFNLNIPIDTNIVVISNTQSSTSVLTPPEEYHHNNNNNKDQISNPLSIDEIEMNNEHEMIGLTIGNHHNTTIVEEINNISTINDSNKSTAPINNLSNKNRRYNSSRSNSSFDKFGINIPFIEIASKKDRNNIMEKNEYLINSSNDSNFHSSDNDEIVNDTDSCKIMENHSNFSTSQEDDEIEINEQLNENKYKINGVNKTDSILPLNSCSTNYYLSDAETIINSLQLVSDSPTKEQNNNENISDIEMPSSRYKTIYSSSLPFPNRGRNTNDVSDADKKHQLMIDEVENKSFESSDVSSTHESDKNDSIQTNATKRQINNDLQRCTKLLSSNDGIIDHNHLQNEGQGTVNSHSINNIVQNNANRIEENIKLIYKNTIQKNNSTGNITNKKNSNDLNGKCYHKQDTIYSIDDMDIEQSSITHSIDTDLTNTIIHHNFQQINKDNQTDELKIEKPQHIANYEPFRCLTNIQPFANMMTIVHRSESSTLNNTFMDSFTQTICVDEPSLAINKNCNGNSTINGNDNCFKLTMDSTVNHRDTSITENESMIKHVLENIDRESTFMGTQYSDFIIELINDDSESLLPFNTLSNKNNPQINIETLCSEISTDQEINHTVVNLIKAKPTCNDMNDSLWNCKNDHIVNNNINDTNLKDLVIELEENQNNNSINENIKVTPQTDDLETISTLSIRSDLRSSIVNVSHNNEVKEERKAEEEHLYCPICCVQIFYSFEEHIISYHSFAKSYDCEMCRESFSSSDELQIHFKSHANQVNPYKCPLCNKRFRLVDEIVHHIVTHATSKKSASKNLPSTKSTPIRSLSNVKLQKQSAFKSLPQLLKSTDEVQSTLTQAKIKKSSHISKSCAKKQTVLNVKKNKSQVRSTSKRYYKCIICKNQFSSNSNYLNHLRKSYYNLIPFKCKECQKLHYNFYELIKHFDEYPDHNTITADDYNDKKSFECYNCKKVFKCFYNCQYHIKKYH